MNNYLSIFTLILLSCASIVALILRLNHRRMPYGWGVITIITIGLFRFGLFYLYDLEMCRGANITTNGDLFDCQVRIVDTIQIALIQVVLAVILLLAIDRLFFARMAPGEIHPR